jgi:dTDP-glucose pyrophosphorylase
MSLDEAEIGGRVNVIVLAAGQSMSNSDDGRYPLCLTEIDGAPLIQHIIIECLKIHPRRLVVAFRKEDVEEFHLDDVVRLLAPTAIVICGDRDTRGAACTALLAMGHVDNDDELLIVNANEFVDVDYLQIIGSFKDRAYDAGTVTFPSIHPRYSYVRVSEKGLVVEAAEKRPISRHATAGFYWFVRGSDFVRAAQTMIVKDAAVNGEFYICPALNELVLEQARIGIFAIRAEQYSPMKTARQIRLEDIEMGMKQ